MLEIVEISLESWGAVFAAVTAFSVALGRSDEVKRSDFLASLLATQMLALIFDVLAIAFSGNTSTAAYYITRISNFMTFLLMPVLVMLMSGYLYVMASAPDYTPRTRALRTVGFIGVIHIVLIVVSQFTDFLYYVDAQNVYHRTSNFALAAALGALELVVLGVMTVSERKRLTRFEFWSTMAFLTLPFVTNIFQALYYGISLNNISVLICLMVMFLTHQVERSRRLVAQERELAAQERELAAHELQIAEQQAQLAKKDAELAEKRVQISVSQMQPHFAFNALGSIEQLCRINPKMAATATHHFAQYLRRNLKALTSTELATLEEEMNHVRTYVWLEKMRFGDDVEFTEDIRAKDFRIPALTIQPLVENSIKHGMMGMEEGTLHVIVRTEELPDYYQVTVSDDGCGFDPEAGSSDNGTHVGLENVTTRVEMMLGGKLTIRSKPGQNTDVIIQIPKDRQKTES